MQQSDPFYEKLPFTLQDDQLQPEYVIFGTGLQQSAFSAYLSKMTQKRCLIFDQQKNYGSCLKTITLKQLHQMSQKNLTQRLYTFYIPQNYKQSNTNFFNECISTKVFRGYNIDIEPSFFFGDSITCQCLKQADMDKYMDFRLVSHMLKYEKGSFSQVPLSKGKIFQSKQLLLLEKKTLLSSLHTLMKLSQRHLKIEEDQNSTKQFDKGFGQVSQEMFQQFNQSKETYFLPFLQKITKKNKKIIDFISYIICNYQYNVNKPIPEHLKQQYKLKTFIQKFGKFISSCGIYGQTPYLYVDNGIGDIPQAFSRISSIFGSTYILHPKLQIDSIQQTEEGVIIKSNIAPQKQIKAKKIFYGETYTQLYAQKSVTKVQLHSDNILRVIILCKKLGKQESCPSLGYFLDLQGFINPVYMFMFDESSHTCPSGYILYQFSTVVELPVEQGEIEKFINNKVQYFVEKLCQIRGKQLKESIAYAASYIRKANSFQFQSNKLNYVQNPSKQICLQGSWGLDLDETFQNFTKLVGKHENYFRKKNPYQDEYQEDQQCERDNILSRLQNINIHKKQEIKNEEQSNQVGKESQKIANIQTIQQNTDKIYQNVIEQAQIVNAITESQNNQNLLQNQ